MKKFYKKYKKAFTLIELLVVISIVSLLSSIIFASVNETRAKARDSKKIQEISQVKTALNLFYDSKGYMPGQSYVGTKLEEGSDTTGDEYNEVMQEMVSEGFLGDVPDSSDDAYTYLNTGSSVFFEADLENFNNNIYPYISAIYEQINVYYGDYTFLVIFRLDPDTIEYRTYGDVYELPGDDLWCLYKIYDLQYLDVYEKESPECYNRIPESGVCNYYRSGGGGGGVVQCPKLDPGPEDIKSFFEHDVCNSSGKTCAVINY